MPRYVIIAVLLAASAFLFKVDWTGIAVDKRIDSLPDWAIVAVIVFFVTAPSLVVFLVTYDVIRKVTGYMTPRRWRSRFFAVVGMLAVAFGVPFGAHQWLERQVQAELANDFAFVGRRDPAPLAALRISSPHVYAEKCNYLCRDLLLSDRVASLTAQKADGSAVQTFAYARDGDCLDLTYFVFGRDQPYDYDPVRVQGRCIVAADTPETFAVDVQIARYAEDTYFNGTVTTIMTPTADNTGVLFRRSEMRPLRPVPILGLVTERTSSWGGPMMLGLTRSSSDMRSGIDQSLEDALLLVLPPPS